MNITHAFGRLRTLRASIAAFAVLALAITGLVVLAPIQAASADTNPPAGTPATVTANPLPTWQIDGLVWAQVLVGNTVYATGSFTQARPPGTPAGSPQSISANNIFAYDIRTGNPVGFNHSLNAQGLAITASPDGSRVYVAGDFTSVDGQARGHIAAFDTATGALVGSFAPSINNQVKALAATNTTVYAGGAFFGADGKTRRRLASFAASNGAITNWAPQADDNSVMSMTMAPGSSKVVVGGAFTTLNGVPANGMGALDATTGATLPWAANTTIRDGGTGSAIDALRTDGNLIYGSGYAFQTGQFEGAFAADPATGNIVWANDCHGDTYDVLPMGQVLYTVSHAHDCSPIGEFPDTNPRQWHHALAFTTYATGMNTGPDSYGWDYRGVPDATLLHWYPDLGIGSYAGQHQAAWAIAGNSQYIALGGEFPTVNGKAQYGLTRFNISGNGTGPLNSSSLTPTATSLSPGTARVSWGQTWDYDSANLTYDVYRDSGTTPVYSASATSVFWKLHGMGFVDSGLTAGSTHTYRVKVSDAQGNTITSSRSNSVTITNAAPSAYAQDVVADGASDYWRLGETSGTTSFDYAGFNDMTDNSGVGHGATGAINGDSDAASTFDGSTSGLAVTKSTVPPPTSFTAEMWIKTTTHSGGKILGYGSSATGNSSSYDRHVYMDNSGRIYFGVYPGGVRTLSSSGRYNDGAWHYVVASLGSNGMSLYIDGKRVGRDAGTTSAQDYTGYWRIGGDNLNGWPSQPSSNYFGGTIDDVAIYPSVLSSTQIIQHYVDSGRASPAPPKPADAYGQAVYDDSPNLYWRLDEASGLTAADTTPEGSDGTYTGIVSYGQSGAVPGTDTAVGFDGFTGAVYGNNAVTNPTTYSEELWFKTSTMSGGKIIGFGNAQAGLSSNYDRHVIMLNTGQLQFGVWTGQQNIIQSANAYNDGKWHYLVATQGADGMNLYVDDQLIGSNPQTGAQAYTGYWRIGGDTTWGGTSSNYFAGSIDEVAVYGAALTPSQIDAHWAAAGGTVPNKAPTAAFTDSAGTLAVSVDGSDSTDADGSIASYDWSWGDNTADGSGKTADHTYASAGTYTVTLTVTDNDSGTDSISHDVTVAANQAPTAALDASVTASTVSVDGSGSSDADGTIASYDWDYGDGTAHGLGKTATHTYASTGTYTVTLTVTDNDGATDSATQKVVAAAAGTVPRPEHVVIVVEENRSETNIIGNTTDAPYINNTLVAQGALMTNSFAETHPSQPNYIALFSGSTQGVTNDTCPVGPFTSNNVAHQLQSSGFTFGAYSEGLPAVDSLACTSGSYARKHAPWTNFSNVAPGSSMPFSSFPSDYSSLPNVSFVIPNLQNDMHDGTIATGDAWLKQNLDGYVQWAKTHNSLLILTFDEDDNNDNNQIPTVIVGEHALAGSYAQTINHYSVLRTVEEAYGLPSVASATSAAPISGIWGTPNQPPTAKFTDSVNQLTASVDASTSTDSDGTIASYDWDFGDGTGHGSGKTASHQYATAGTYTVTLKVTDNDGATGTVSHDVTVAPTANQSPTAKFTTTANDLAVSVNGTGSTDADGTIASYDWDFGDGTAHGSGATATHTYAADGTYTITLTVTDNDNATGTVSHEVTVSNGAVVVFGTDEFSRTVTNGWGTADSGGDWSRLGSASNFAVNNGTGQITMPQPGGGPSVYLDAVSATGADVAVTLSTDKAITGGGVYVSVIGRHTSVGDYRAVVRLNANGAVQIDLVRVDNAGQAVIVPMTTVSGLTYGVGDSLSVRFQAVGTSPTQLQARVWLTGTPEPANWQVVGADSSAALQTAGSVGLMSYLSGSSTNAPLVTMFDHFVATKATTQPAVLGLAPMTRKAAKQLPAYHASVIPAGADRTSPPFGKAKYAKAKADTTKVGKKAVTKQPTGKPAPKAQPPATAGEPGRPSKALPPASR